MMFDEDGTGQLERHELSRIIRANFMASAITQIEADRKVDEIFQILGGGSSISYEQFMEMSKAHMHLLYPVSQVAHRVGGGAGAQT